MVLGRIILSVDAESYSLIKKKWLTKTFVISDVVCFLVQLAGAYKLPFPFGLSGGRNCTDLF